METKEILIKLKRRFNMATPQAADYENAFKSNSALEIKDEWEKVEIAICRLLESPQIPVFARPMIVLFLDELLKSFREKIKSL